MKRLILALTLAVAPISSIWGQPGGEAEAAQILQAAVDAHGGPGAISRIQGSVSTGQVWVLNADGSRAPYFITVKTSGLDKIWTELKGAGLHRIYISDGQVGWAVRNGNKRPVLAEKAANRITQINPLGLLAAFGERRLLLQNGDVVFRESREVYQITAVVLDQSERRNTSYSLDRTVEVWIDTATNRVTSMVFTDFFEQAFPPQQPSREEFFYSDYRKIEGVWIPFRIEKWVDASPVSEILLDIFASAEPGSIFREP